MAPTTLMAPEQCLPHTAWLILRSVPNVLLPGARVRPPMRLQECGEIITQPCQKSLPGANCTFQSIEKENK